MMLTKKIETNIRIDTDVIIKCANPTAWLTTNWK